MSNIEDKLDIESMLSKLKYEERIAIVLFYNSNYSLNEISEILDTSPNTIKSRITRGKEKNKKNIIEEVLRMKQQKDNIDEIDRLLYDYFEKNDNIPEKNC